MTDNENKYQTAYFAAGCFWGTQYHLAKIEGVIEATAGFMGGKMQHPSYQQVKTGATGHLETVRVVYDPEKTSYETLAEDVFRDPRFHTDRRTRSGHWQPISFGYLLCR
jgi:peptide methionine sulfoxide reductase msrA/msrB